MSAETATPCDLPLTTRHVRLTTCHLHQDMAVGAYCVAAARRWCKMLKSLPYRPIQQAISSQA